MNRHMKSILPIALLLVLVPLTCHAQETKKQIKVLRVGSSSFPYRLIEITRAIVEASGKHELVCANDFVRFCAFSWPFGAGR